jgi:acyl carrier protein
MTPEEILAGLAEVLDAVAALDQAGITPDKSFADLGLDSLTMVEVAVGAEDRFGLLIDDDAWSRCHTVRDATRYIEAAMTC